MVAKDNAVKLAQFLLAVAVKVKPRSPSSNVLDDLLGEHGFDLLGDGNFSLVVKHEAAPGYVIKVVIRDNDSAPAYMAWCRAHPGPHVPRIHHLQRQGRYVVAVLDELRRMDTDRTQIYELHLDRYLEKVTDHPVNAVAQSIRKFFKDAADFDLHPANVMMDLNGELVITDPLSYSDSEKSRALRTGIERAFDIAA